MKYYLAYGSNLNTKQMGWRCPTAKVVGTTMIKNYKLLFKRGFLTIEPEQDSQVPVAIWQVDDMCEKSLDVYEGFPNFYYKKEITLDDGKKAFVYIMHEHSKLQLPTKAYLYICLEGYEEFGFDKDYLIDALKRSRGKNENS